MNKQIAQISARIRELREILEIPPEEAAAKVGLDLPTYERYESGVADIPIGVLYGLATHFGVDPTVLMTGDGPRMDDYTIVRKGHGIKIERFAGYAFQALAFNFKNRQMDPMIVTIAHSDHPELVTHEGQEFNFVLEGTIAVNVNGSVTILDAGDSIYFNPALPHGQNAVTSVAKFLTVINE